MDMATNPLTDPKIIVAMLKEVMESGDKLKQAAAGLRALEMENRDQKSQANAWLTVFRELWAVDADTIREANSGLEGVLAVIRKLTSIQAQIYQDALDHAAFYVRDHCPDGERHAEIIADLKIPSKYAAKGAA